MIDDNVKALKEVGRIQLENRQLELKKSTIKMLTFEVRHKQNGTSQTFNVEQSLFGSIPVPVIVKLIEDFESSHNYYRRLSLQNIINKAKEVSGRHEVKDQNGSVCIYYDHPIFIRDTISELKSDLCINGLSKALVFLRDYHYTSKYSKSVQISALYNLELDIKLLYNGSITMLNRNGRIQDFLKQNSYSKCFCGEKVNCLLTMMRLIHRLQTKCELYAEDQQKLLHSQEPKSCTTQEFHDSNAAHKINGNFNRKVLVQKKYISACHPVRYKTVQVVR